MTRPAHPYSISLVWSDEDEAYVANVPEWRGVSALGSTPEQAVKELMEALRLAVKASEDDGTPLPEPKCSNPKSGQFRLRVPADLHLRLSREAEESGESLNAHVIGILKAQQSVRSFAESVVSLLEERSRSAVFGNLMTHLDFSTIPALHASQAVRLGDSGSSFYRLVVSSIRSTWETQPTRPPATPEESWAPPESLDPALLLERHGGS